MNIMTQMVEPMLAAVEPVLPGLSAVLYGSLVRGDHLPGHSDVNLLLVTDQLDTSRLHRLAPAYSSWVAHQVAPPLLMTREEWRRASDVFPVEITDMRAGYRVLRGPDPLEGTVVRRPDLRAGLEREFRGKLARLRQGFIPSEQRPQDLGLMARQSIASLAVLWRGTLALAGQTPPGPLGEVLQRAGQLLGFDPAPLADIPRHRGDAAWRCSLETFADYLAAVELSVGWVDNFQTGEEA